MTDAPRILDEESARAYLGGRLNPNAAMPPVKIGGRNCWDRKALDLKLDSLFGIPPDRPSKGEESPLDRWKRRKGLAGEDAA